MKKSIKSLVLFLGIISLFACSKPIEKEPTTVDTVSDIAKELTTIKGVSDMESLSEATQETTVAEVEKSSSEINHTIPINKEDLPEYVPGTVKLLPQIQPFGPETTKYKYKRKYRLIYYTTANFDKISQELYPEKLEEWREYILANPEHEKEFTEMQLVTYIKFFNIPKEVFDERLEYWKQRQLEGEYDPAFDAENGELPNSDILYTFDNEIINRYYRYE